MSADRLAAAELAARGLAVFPLPPGGRRPTAPGWQHTATADVDAVLETWPTGANIGIACRPSRLLALDLDDPDALARACAAHHQGEPHTLTVRTPSGGRHAYFRAPAGCTIPSSSGGRTRLGPGVDVRGPGLRTGGYLIGPGSVVGDVPYVIEREAPIAPLPGWLAELLAGRQ